MILIAIEGTDGSGKGTQSRILHERLQKEGIPAIRLDFPQYEKTFFGAEIANYLNGEFGSLMQVPAKLGAMLYAGDRWESRELIETELIAGTAVICDRYVGSNQAHHGAKLERSQWTEFFNWVEHLEYDTFSMPRPDIEIYLDVDPLVSASLILQKAPRHYTNRSADIHEIDTKYQTNVREAYLELSLIREWRTIQCMREAKLRPQGEIADEVWGAVSSRLA